MLSEEAEILVFMVKNRMWFLKLTSRTECTQMSDSLPVVTVLLTFSTARKRN